MALENLVPAGGDFDLIFTKLKYTLLEAIDFDKITEVVLSISRDDPTINNVANLSSLTDKSRFNINNSDKKVVVRVLASDIGSTLSKYYANLWIIDGNNNFSHRKPFEFRISAAVNFTAGGTAS